MSGDDLAGRRYVVTGANTGVGRATAEALARRGAEVVLACRSEARAADALTAIERAGGAARFLPLDLASLASVGRAARRLERLAPLDALINNAGVGGARGQTSDGFELAFGVNYLGHAAWTRMLLGALRSDGRVVHLGSGSHEKARGLSLDRAREPTRSWTGVREYARSKLCVMLFHAELSRRLAGSGRRSVAVDPGDVASEAFRHVPWPARAFVTCGMRSPAEAARTPVFAATDPRAAHGRLYCAMRERAPSPLAMDPGLARRLWEATDRWLGYGAASLRPSP